MKVNYKLLIIVSVVVFKRTLKQSDYSTFMGAKMWHQNPTFYRSCLFFAKRHR